MSVPFSHFFFGRNVYTERERERERDDRSCNKVRNNSYRASLVRSLELDCHASGQGKRERERGGGRGERGRGEG